MKKKIVIVGGSIAGLTSALVLASAKNDKLDFDMTVVDEGKPDLNSVAIYNVPLFPRGILGSEIISRTKEQIAGFMKVHYISGKVTEVAGTKGNFSVKGDGFNLSADYVILATGATAFDIDGLGDIVYEHDLMNKPKKVRLRHTGRQEVRPGIYAAGLASGVTTMVTAAMGSASEAACAILSDIEGKVAIVHDTPSSRK